MALEQNLITFNNFIANILEKNKNSIQKQNFNILFKVINQFISIEYEQKEKRKVIWPFHYFINNDNSQEKLIEKITLNGGEEYYINAFKDELIKINFIYKEFILDEDIIKSILEYAKKYLYFKSELKKNKYYINSFYEDFRNKTLNMIRNTRIIIEKQINKYLRDIIPKTLGVVQTIEKQYNMNEKEFEEKYSEKIRLKIISDITSLFQSKNKELIKEVKNTADNYLNITEKLNCDESDPSNFEITFQKIKEEMNYLFKFNSLNMDRIYNDFQNSLNKKIEPFFSNLNENEKKTKHDIKFIHIKNFIENVNFNKVSFLEHRLKNTLGFFSFGYFGGHDYKDDIKKTCGDYKQMISNAFTITEKNMKENLEDVKNDKIELINLIFKTAASNFEE